MLEILFVYFLCKKMGAFMGDKGLNPLPWQILTPVAWFGGEFFAAVVAAIVLNAQGSGSTGPDLCVVYFCALLGAFMGVLALFLLAAVIPAARRERSYEDDYRDYKDKGHTGDDRPKRRRKRERDDEDEEDRPRSRRRSDDDDEDDRPRRRRRSDEDDEDDRPRRRSDDRYRE
jgi:hypothetical protein